MTRKYECSDIEHVYYKDAGGIWIVFRDGKKLSFDKQEYYFYREILKREGLKCKYKGDENPVMKAYFHPFMMCPCWLICGCAVVGSLWESSLVVFAILALLFCVGCQLSNTIYDRKSKVLTRRICGFARKYDMKEHSAKPVYENGFLMKIEIYKKNKKVANVPVSVEYKNRARLIRELCGVEV